MHSHHSHSGQFCAHAKGTLEEVVLEAIKQGFKVYGLSEHVPRYRVKDLYPEEESLGLVHLSTTFDSYVKEAHRLREVYKDKISLLVGLETDYITNVDLDGLTQLLDKHAGVIDYIVGSIHHVNEFGFDFDKPTFNLAIQSYEGGAKDARVPVEPRIMSQEALSAYLTAYFDAQYTIMTTIHPEIIGHFDLCRLWMPDLKLQSYPDVWEKIHRNVEFAISYGALFELNAAAFRKGWDTSYPGEEIIHLILEKGGRFALSDDSHGPHAVGLNYHRLKEYMTRMKINEIWYLERADGPNSAGRKVRSKLYQGDWSRDDFWLSQHPIQ